MNGRALERHAMQRLGIGFGETTPDGGLTLEAVYCLGLCACSPAAMIDEQVHGRLTPTFRGVTYEKLDRLGSIQWPCNDAAPDGTPKMRVGNFVRGKGKFYLTEYVATSERSTSRYPLILTTGRVLYQYNVGTQTRRTANLAWQEEDRLEIHPDDAENRGIADGDWVGVTSRTGDTVMRAIVSRRVTPGVVYTTFHFPESGVNLVTTENSDWSRW